MEAVVIEANIDQEFSKKLYSSDPKEYLTQDSLAY